MKSSIEPVAGGSKAVSVLVLVLGVLGTMVVVRCMALSLWRIRPPQHAWHFSQKLYPASPSVGIGGRRGRSSG